MKRLFIRRTILPVAALLVFLTTALGQTAQVTGRISDSAGAIVPGAQIALTNQANGFKRETVTNDDRDFRPEPADSARSAAGFLNLS